ncbi:MAG: hypothetical protein ACJ790_07760 [Myxococcaceae bacterium]
MNPFFKKTLIAGLVSAAALTVGCTRTYEHHTAAQANYPATNTNATANANTDVVPDGTQPPNAELPIQTGPQFGAAGQTNDINADQDMTSENADELGYGGSGKAGMDGGMMMHKGAMDGGMMEHGAMMDHDMMMDGGTMMDMDAGTKMKAGGKMKKK